jgi:WD40 repeat protein
MPGNFAHCLAFAPDGRVLATGHADGIVLFWDMEPAWKKLSPPPTVEDFSKCWNDLAATDPASAYAAIARFVDGGDSAVRFLGDRLKPVRVDAGWIAKRLADLNDDSYPVRETATQELEKVVESVEPELRREFQKIFPQK